MTFVQMGENIYSSNVTSMCEQCFKIYPRTKTWNKLVDCVNVVCRICNLKRMSFNLPLKNMKLCNKKGNENKNHSQFKIPHHKLKSWNLCKPMKLGLWHIKHFCGKFW
jgi:hypothetical protein